LTGSLGIKRPCFSAKYCTIEADSNKEIGLPIADVKESKLAITTTLCYLTSRAVFVHACRDLGIRVDLHKPTGELFALPNVDHLRTMTRTS
jgi:hypothetical protein